MESKTKEAKIFDFDSLSLSVCPFMQFSNWYEVALSTEEITYPHAFTLSTLNPAGYPEGRVVLMKDFSKDCGITFYTNTMSTKGKSIKVYPRVGCTFFWDSLGKQVRILGDAYPLSSTEADEYFKTRLRDSQLGAWASNQSMPISARALLLEKLEDYRKSFEEKVIPRPGYWSGYGIKPNSFEFWTFGHNRLHHRYKYSKEDKNKWQIEILQP